jgi:hypothetical protein
MGINQREMIPWGGDKKPTGFYCTKTNCFVLPVKRKKNQRLKISFTLKNTMELLLFMPELSIYRMLMGKAGDGMEKLLLEKLLDKSTL